MNETWKPVVGFEGRYEVSDLGRVRSLTVRTHRRLIFGRVLKQSPHRQGYPCVCLADGSKGKYCKVHKLVTEAFLGQCPEGKCVAHNDGSTTNNALSNLRYATLKENAADRWKHGTIINGEKCHFSKLTSEQVREIRKLIGVKSHEEIAKLFSVSATAISYIRTGKRWRWLV